MKLLFTALATTLIFILPLSLLHASSDIRQPDLAELADYAVAATSTSNNLFDHYNQLNNLIRDGKIGREKAKASLNSLLSKIREEYYRGGGRDFLRKDWVFPVSGYDCRAITGGRRKGYVASGYDFFSGNRHGGHPAFDIFIHDHKQNCKDDSNSQPVKVLSLTGGVVVAQEKEWKQGSHLRGGKYIWIYDPGNDALVYYAHNNEVLVDLGDIVRPGDVIATVGRSGFNAEKKRSPTHLHLSVLSVKDGRMVPYNAYPDLKKALLLPGNK